MDYKLFNAEEFAADESFINYYLKRDEKAVAYWTNWISRHPEKLDEVLTAERLLANVHLRLTEEEQDLAFNRFNDFINETISVENDHLVDLNSDNTGRAYRNLSNWKIGAIAASITLMVTLAGLYFNKQPLSTLKTVYVTVHNDYGKIKILSLADGTQVSLNANSSLTYPKHFEPNRRDVTLSGEAFFEVAKDKDRPFTVHTNGTKTRVLGTKFNVNAYTKEKTSVALLEGSVAFEPGHDKGQSLNHVAVNAADNKLSNDEIILKPLQMVTYAANTDQVKISGFDVKNVTAWRTGVILFNHASFNDVAAKFQNTYGVELKDNSSSKQWNYSGQFTKSDYLTIIKSICFAKNLTYKQNNHTIIFNNK